MITLRRADERRHSRRRRQDAWRTFSASDRDDPLAGGFGALRMLNEDRLPPGARLSHPQHDSEIVTYVREGALAYEDSMGRSGIIQAGEFRYVSTRRQGCHTETNLSRTAWAHVFQLWVCPSELELEPSDEQKRFSSAERRGILCVVASPDARRGSLRIHQDALLYSAMLDPGRHVVHELAAGTQRVAPHRAGRCYARGHRPHDRRRRRGQGRARGLAHGAGRNGAPAPRYRRSGGR